MHKLLASGKTDLLPFVSARTRRPFAAYLVRQPDGKIGLEFEAKAGAKGRGTSADQGRQAGCEIGAPQARRIASREPRCARGRYAQEEGYSALYRVRTATELYSLSERKLATPIDRAGLAAHVGLPRIRSCLAPSAG